ncbi:HMGL-like family protein, partial [Vibrio parahaemolyticus V-223/04]
PMMSNFLVKTQAEHQSTIYVAWLKPQLMLEQAPSTFPIPLATQCQASSVASSKRFSTACRTSTRPSFQCTVMMTWACRSQTQLQQYKPVLAKLKAPSMVSASVRVTAH